MFHYSVFVASCNISKLLSAGWTLTIVL